MNDRVAGNLDRLEQTLLAMKRVCIRSFIGESPNRGSFSILFRLEKAPPEEGFHSPDMLARRFSTPDLGIGL